MKLLSGTGPTASPVRASQFLFCVVGIERVQALAKRPLSPDLRNQLLKSSQDHSASDHVGQ